MFRWLSVFVLVLLARCSNDIPTLDGIDLNAWRTDKNACGTYRTTTLEMLQNQKEKLLALDESKIIELLGRPDRNELYKRNQKFYYYYLKPSADCLNASLESKRLAIRFNAMGLAKEVAVE